MELHLAALLPEVLLRAEMLLADQLLEAPSLVLLFRLPQATTLPKSDKTDSSLDLTGGSVPETATSGLEISKTTPTTDSNRELTRLFESDLNLIISNTTMMIFSIEFLS